MSDARALASSALSNLSGRPPPTRPEYSVFDFDTYQVCFTHCEIRPDKSLGPRRARLKTPWSVELGLFKDYLREEREDLVTKCFDFDWVTMKPIRLKASDAEDIRAEMLRVYPVVKETYRHQAGYSPAGTVFSVSQQQLSMYLADAIACFDQETTGRLRPADQGRIVAAVTSKRQKELPSAFNPPA